VKNQEFILNRLNEMVSGAEMYYIKSFETRHDFEFCKNGTMIGESIHLFFEETDNNTPTY